MRIFAAFVLGLVLTVAIVVAIPTPRDARYDVLTDDALHLTDAYRRITRDPKPIDVAFIGSSHTMNGIDDRSLESGLAQAGVKVNVANLGVPWAGRDLELLLVKLLYAYKAPKLMIVELDQHEDPSGHPLFPYVADAADMMCCKRDFSYDFPAALLTFARRQWRQLAEPLSDPTAARPPPVRDYGWVPLYGGWNAEQAALSRQKARLSGVWGAAKTRFFQMASPFGLDAVRQIVDLAQAHGTKIAFLYLPARHYLEQGPPITNISFYRAIGPILLVPQHLVEDDRDWANWSHINEHGAELIVPCLVADVARLAAPAADVENPAMCGRRPLGAPYASER